MQRRAIQLSSLCGGTTPCIRQATYFIFKGKLHNVRYIVFHATFFIQ